MGGDVEVYTYIQLFLLSHTRECNKQQENEIDHVVYFLALNL